MRIIQLSYCSIVAAAVTAITKIEREDGSRYYLVHTTGGTMNFSKASDVAELDAWEELHRESDNALERHVETLRQMSEQALQRMPRPATLIVDCKKDGNIKPLVIAKVDDVLEPASVLLSGVLLQDGSELTVTISRK